MYQPSRLTEDDPKRDLSLAARHRIDKAIQSARSSVCAVESQIRARIDSGDATLDGDFFRGEAFRLRWAAIRQAAPELMRTVRDERRNAGFLWQEADPILKDFLDWAAWHWNDKCSGGLFIDRSYCYQLIGELGMEYDEGCAEFLDTARAEHFQRIRLLYPARPDFPSTDESYSCSALTGAVQSLKLFTERLLNPGTGPLSPMWPNETSGRKMLRLHTGACAGIVGRLPEALLESTAEPRRQIRHDAPGRDRI